MSSAQPARRTWTYGNLAALPDDQLRHELIDGEHVVTPSPAIPHQVILWNLVEVLGPYLRANPFGTALTGPVDVKLSLFTVLVPDLVYFTAERFARVVNEKHATAAPDLVVEILSPGTRRRDKGRKRAVYDREGVGEYLDRRSGEPIDYGAAAASCGRWSHGRDDVDARGRRRSRVAPLSEAAHSLARRLPRPLTARRVARNRRARQRTRAIPCTRRPAGPASPLANRPTFWPVGLPCNGRPFGEIRKCLGMRHFPAALQIPFHFPRWYRSRYSSAVARGV